MFKRCDIVKKVSSILMATIVFSTFAMSGYAAESIENSSVVGIRGGY